jgi:hypothetical protein
VIKPLTYGHANISKNKRNCIGLVALLVSWWASVPALHGQSVHECDLLRNRRKTQLNLAANRAFSRTEVLRLLRWLHSLAMVS